MLDILLIEDNPVDVFLFETYIDDSDLVGSRITSVGSLQDAISQIKAMSFDIVMLDLSLPDGRGKETLRRAKKAFTSLPVIVLSGIDDVELAKTSVHEGIQDYLVKGSINAVLLARAINHAIERNELLNEKAAIERHLVERNRYLEIANRRLEDFAYTVSHNLRAPLARILGLCQIIRYESLEDQAEKMVDLIDQSARGLDCSIKDLMELLIVQKHAKDPIDVVNVEGLFKEVVDSLSAQVQAAKALITSTFATSCIVHSEFILRNVLLNLLSNAIKYRSLRRPLNVQVTFRPVNRDWCCLSVSDNGLGMNMSEAGPQLFQLFTRFHSHVEGRGIGLHTVKSLVEECGGRIEVESTLNVGTTVKVYFPDQRSADHQPKPSRQENTTLVSAINLHKKPNQVT